MRTAAPPAAGEVFTELAGLWPAHDRDRRDAITVAARRVIRVLRPGGNVLDVGCGTGAMLARIRGEAHRQGRRIGETVGLDVAEGMVDMTAMRRGVTAVAGDGCRLPFADQVFDVVVATHVLHLLADPVRAAREMFRVAVPGGTIVVELPAEKDPGARRIARVLPARSLLRRYVELPRTFGVAAFRATLAELGCELSEIRARGPHDTSGRLLARIARTQGGPRELDVARALERRDQSDATRVLIARLPGPRSGTMPIEVEDLPGWSAARVQRVLRGLPRARGYRLVVKPLRYRTRPHVQAFCEFDEKRIIVQVPVPFRPFYEDVPYRAQRVRDAGFRFRWYRHRLRFHRPDELIRYLYLHEYYHWYLREVMGRPSSAETACDRFALQRVYVADHST